MRVISFVLLMMISAVAISADFQIVTVRGGDYMIIATGEIEQGDAAELRRIFVNKQRFPTVTRIKTAGGSMQPATALGELYRSSSLAVLADEGCDMPCFLWLVGGTSRAASGDIFLEQSGLKQRSIEQYLKAMDIPAKTAKTWAKQKAEVLSSERFLEDIGERPAVVQRWVTEACGDLTDTEKRDFRAVQAAGFLEALKRLKEKRPEDLEIDTIIARYKTLAARAASISDEKTAALQEKWFKRRACKQAHLASRQSDALEKLTKEEKAATAT
ncbi:MAG: hypothetical protein AAGI24_04490 [Pseudomonadota bacterium]